MNETETIEDIDMSSVGPEFESKENHSIDELLWRKNGSRDEGANVD